MRLIELIIVSCSVLLYAGTTFAQEEALEGSGSPIAWAKDKPALEVISPDDPHNPYRSQYGEWDRWFHANPGEPDSQQAWDYRRGNLPENWILERVRVDVNGNPVPMLVELRYELSQVAAGLHPTTKDSYQYDSWGQMPLELWQAYHDAKLRVYAQFVPEIPAWLADNPPIVARFWTDGSVITHGPLGSWNGKGDVVIHENGRQWYLPDPYYLYSPDGELIRQTEQGDWEQNVFTGPFDPSDPLDGLFYSGWADKVFGHSRACGWRGPAKINAYWVYYNKKTRKRLLIYDMDGTELPADFDVNARDANTTGRIFGGSLKRLRQFQIELGIVKE